MTWTASGVGTDVVLNVDTITLDFNKTGLYLAILDVVDAGVGVTTSTLNFHPTGGVAVLPSGNLPSVPSFLPNQVLWRGYSLLIAGIAGGTLYFTLTSQGAAGNVGANASAIDVISLQ
jgi:hypothetical protein